MSDSGMSTETAPSAQEVEAAKQEFEQGRKAENRGDRWSAIEAYERAFELDPENPEICFRLAYHLDLVGEEKEALHLYEQACESDERAKINALINLAVAYEDVNKYTRAEKCLKLVLETAPNHERARLYLKDVQASREMYVEDGPAGLLDPSGTLYETPVTDFELSVRARNCLKKMNIRSLGDLLRTSEAELLSYKNFGGASLSEIKAVLASRGLRLGQALEGQQSPAVDAVFAELEESGHEEILNKPIDELDLSARARKAVSLLNVHTVGDLASRTEAELLGVKNFGQTSLDEIKAKLGEMGVMLRQLED